MIKLTPKEYALLEFFMGHPGEIYAQLLILEENWDFLFDISSNIIDVHRFSREFKGDQEVGFGGKYR